MSFQEDNLDDYKINPKTLELRGGNEIMAFVETFFDEYELRFSLLELVLLDDQGIGETFTFAKKGFDHAGFYQRYLQIVNRFKEEYSGGVSAYKEWYSRKTWWSQGQGLGEKTTYIGSQFNWEMKGELRDASLYGAKETVPEPYKNFGEFAQNYFDKYEESILKLGLDAYPFYTIIIKPLGYIDAADNYEVKPLGNLYLHFGTNIPVPEEIRRAFIKDFLIVWGRNYGGIVIEEALRKLSLLSLGDHEGKDYLPNVFPLTGDKRKLLLSCYNKFFSNEEHVELLAGQTNVLLRSVLPDLKYIKENPSTNKKIDKRYTEQPKLEKIINPFNAQSFLYYLLRRKISACSVLHLGYSYEETHLLMTKGNLQTLQVVREEKVTRQPNTIYGYFLNSLNFSFRENMKDQISSLMRNAISNRETAFINSLV